MYIYIYVGEENPEPPCQARFFTGCVFSPLSLRFFLLLFLLPERWRVRKPQKCLFLKARVRLEVQLDKASMPRGIFTPTFGPMAANAAHCLRGFVSVYTELHYIETTLSKPLMCQCWVHGQHTPQRTLGSLHAPRSYLVKLDQNANPFGLGLTFPVCLSVHTYLNLSWLSLKNIALQKESPYHNLTTSLRVNVTAIKQHHQAS